MSQTINVPRELLERLETWVTDDCEALHELQAILAAPRQPEGDSISLERVQAEADAFFDWPTADKSSVTTKSCLIFARCIAGMVAAERDAAIAELRDRLDATSQCADNYSRMFEESSEEMEAAASQAEYQHGRAEHFRAQRDRLAGLLYEASGELRTDRHHGLRPRIDAALAEMNK